MLTCPFKCKRFMSVSPLPTISPSSGEKKKKKKLLRDLCQSDLPLCLFPHPPLTLAPQESASPLRSVSSDLMWRSCNCLSACLRYNEKHFLKVKSVILLPAEKKPRTSANVGKQDVCFWLSYFHLFFLDSLQLSDTIITLFDQSLLC